MRALLSVSDRTGLIELARGLASRGFELVATSGTAKALEEAGLRARLVEEFTGAPEMLGGRVKTLHPKVHGGLLARPDRDDDRADVERAGLELIDVAVINLYPFAQTIARGCTFEEAIEQIDIGGPAMLRASAKNAARVTVVCRPSDYDEVLTELDRAGGPSPAFRRRLQAQAFAHTATYDAQIADYLARTADTEPLPETLPLAATRVRELRYGENPHQRGALYRLRTTVSPSLVDAQVLQGKELSYNNYLDASAAVECLVDVPRKDSPAAVVVKHMVPCGVAIRSSLADAYREAREADPVSAFGGIVALSHTVDEATAKLLAETFLEVIVAPDFDDAARALLAVKKNLRLLVLPGLAEAPSAEGIGRLELRSIPGGLLVQERDLALVNLAHAKVVSRKQPTAEDLRDLGVAWAVCKHVRSNAIVLAKDGVAVGVGPGQPNRRDSVRLAADRAAERAKGTALASDAFFPFADGIIAAAEAGARAIVQPGGSVRDTEVIAAADERDLVLLFTGERHFKH